MTRRINIKNNQYCQRFGSSCPTKPWNAGLCPVGGDVATKYSIPQRSCISFRPAAHAAVDSRTWFPGCQQNNAPHGTKFQKEFSYRYKNKHPTKSAAAAFYAVVQQRSPLQRHSMPSCSNEVRCSGILCRRAATKSAAAA
jgi:hypothetical protein